MRVALLSLAMGALVGAAYGLCGLRSPAPPVVALLGLLGMVLGEQAALRVRARSSAPAAARPAAPGGPGVDAARPGAGRRRGEVDAP